MGVLKSINEVYQGFKALSIYEFATWGRCGVNSMGEGVSMHNTHLFGLGISIHLCRVGVRGGGLE